MSIGYLSKDIECLLSELGENISELKAILKDNTSSKAINVANDKLSEVLLICERIKTSKLSYKIEIESSGAHTQALHSKKLLQFEESFKEFSTIVEQYTEKLQSLNPFEILGEKLKHETKAKKLISWGDNVQDKTQESIKNMIKITADAERIGDDIMRDLERQTETLNRVQRNFSNVDSNITSAKITVNAIAKNILKDKFVKVMLIGILILSISCICVYFISTTIKGDNMSNHSEQKRGRGPVPNSKLP